MKAPDKIYLHPIAKGEVGASWLTFPLTDEDVEYTRTDAFIEKACVKLKKLMYDNLMFQGRLHREEIIENFVGEFRKYMKE